MVSWQQLSQLFEQALALPRDERVSFLDRVCKDDAALRTELERLLAADDRVRKVGFMEKPPSPSSTSTASVSPVVFLAGDKIADRFRIVRFLGGGGMGQVYQAQDEVLGGFVALKTIRPEIASDQAALDRFKKEVKLAHEVAHENVCRVFDLDHRNQPPFLTMEFIEGETLAAHLRRREGRGMPPAEALPLIEQMAHGLHAAHQKGVVHGDFKPGNVMLQANSAGETRAKITDFGLASTTDGEGSLSSAHLHGTPLYMAPEQLAGAKPNVVTDIYAFGLVVYELVTGQKPAFNRLTEPAPSPQLPAPGLDPKWSQAILRCLERDPSRRFSTALEVATALRGETAPASSATFDAVHRRFTWRRLAVACSVTIALAALTYFGRAIYNQGWHEIPFRQIQVTRLTTSGKAVRAAMSPDGKYLAYVYYDSGQQSLWVSQINTPGNVMLVPPSGGREGYGELAFSPDSAVVYYVKYGDQGPPTLYSIPALGGSSKRVLAEVEGLSPVSLSPEGMRVAFLRTRPGATQTELMLAEVETGDVQKLASLKSTEPLAVAWSPDAKTITCNIPENDASGTFVNIVTIPIAGGSQRVMAHIRLEDVYELAWLPDGRNLILNGVDIPGASRQLWVLNGAELRRITNNLESYSGLSVSRDGSLVTVQQRISSSIWVSPDAATAPWKHFAIMADQDSFGLSWAPDGRIVHSRYGTGGNTEIWITNRDGSHARQLVAGLFKNIWPRVSGDGRYLVFASNRSGAYHLWRIGLDGGNLQQITRGQDESRFDISPDGQWVYFSSGEYQNRKLYKISIQGGSPIQLTNEPAAWPRVSPDGKWIALEVTIGHPTRRTIAVLPAAGGPVITRVKIDSWTPSMPFQWTRDGKALLYVRDGNGASNNVWRLPLAGGKPVPVTNFTGDEEIYWFDLTADGRQLACVRGVSAFDAVMIRAVR